MWNSNRIIPGQYHNVGQPPQNVQNPSIPQNTDEKPSTPSTEKPVNFEDRFGEPVWDVDDVPQVQQNTITNSGGKGKNQKYFLLVSINQSVF